MVALGRGGPYAFVEIGQAHHHDRYFDDDAGHLRDAGLALRQRRTAGGELATLKGAGQVDGAWHRREELEAAMHGDDWPVAIARRLAEHMALWRLRPQLELDVERTSYRVVFSGRPVATLVFDRVTARLPGADRTAHFDEAEIEALDDVDLPVLEGAAALLDALVRLTPSSATKLARAVAVLELGAGF
ncbi:MAG: CYTH domain-containing protein [bacterium]|nr:CYTH domain-containing protein [bacterium]